MKRYFLAIFVLSLLLSLSPFWGFAAPYTIVNGEMAGSAPGNISGWDGTIVSGRENGPYLGTVEYQTINSPYDPISSSGSNLFTAGSGHCSLTQQLDFTATGQTLTLTADVAWDGNWEYIYFGFYEETVWDRMPDASIDITLTVPPDTDGTLDDFHTVSVTGPLTNTTNPVRVFIGSACSPYGVGAQIPGTSKFAIDNVTPDPTPTPTPTPGPLAAENWGLYE